MYLLSVTFLLLVHINDGDKTKVILSAPQLHVATILNGVCCAPGEVR